MRGTFDVYFPELLKHEGGYVDHPSDPGGATKYGITIGTLKAWRGKAVTKADVKALTKAEAAAIYRARYWDAIKADDLPSGLDALAFDIAVNHGVGRWRQWAAIADGKTTLDAIKAVTERRRRFYRALKTFSVFGKGWMRRADDVEAWAVKRARSAAKPVLAKPAPEPVPVPVPEPVATERPWWEKSPVLRQAVNTASALGIGASTVFGLDWRLVAILAVVIGGVSIAAIVIQARK
jgi:lysozyme family protein